MVSIRMEDQMSIDTIYAKAVEKLAQDKGLDIRKLAHDTLNLSSQDVSIREFKRVIRPDAQGRKRELSLREAYEFSRALGETVETVIALGMRFI